MSYWSRIRNALRPERVEREIAGEIESHLEEERAAGGAAFGSPLRYREASRDAKVAPWLDSLRADAVFAWRQLTKRKTATLVVVLSLATGIGAVLSGFRLVDAGFLRTLPVRDPHRLHFLRYTMTNIDGASSPRDSFSYAEFRAMRAALAGEAEVMMASFADRQDITFGGHAEVEKVSRQFVSGAAFENFGLAPAAGRLLGRGDDDAGANHRVSVVTHDYAQRRFGSAAAAMGRSFRYLEAMYEIVGVIEPKFTGTSTGVVMDVFIPLLANEGATRGSGASDDRSARILVHLAPGAAPERAAGKLRAAFRREREAVVKRHPTAKAFADAYLGARLNLLPAANGISNFERDFRFPVAILTGTAILLLLLCCAGVANLLTIQAAARGREMALRISIGAGRRRLIQLVLVESLMLGAAAAVAGMLFAWWSAPLVVSGLNPPDNPVRLQLAMDGRVVLAALALAFAVTILSGLPAALRAQATAPSEALKDGAASIAPGRAGLLLTAAQVAFCVLVCFVAGLLGGSLRRLDAQDIGFAPERVLLMETAASGEAPPFETWNQLRERVTAMPGVEAAAWSGWPVQTGGANIGQIQVGARPVEIQGPYTFQAAAGWFDAMGIPMIEGRDFRPGENGPAAIVNRQFARHYFEGRSPIGQTFTAWNQRVEIVGVVGDFRMRDIRENIRPTAFFPLAGSRSGALAIRLRPGLKQAALAGPLRTLVAEAFPRLRVDDIRMQDDLVKAQTVRERLVAGLAGFFGAVALVLAGIGLYGVFAHSVARRSREFAIRMALGAGSRAVAANVLRETLIAPVLGAAAGLLAGRGVESRLRPFLFEISGLDSAVIGPVLLALAAAAAAAAIPAVLRATRIDPARALRAE